MKRSFGNLLKLLILAILVFTLAACGNQETPTDTKFTESGEVTEAVEETEEVIETESEETEEETEAEAEEVDPQTLAATDETQLMEIDIEEVKQANTKEADVLSGTLVTDVDMSHYPEGSTVRLWIPVAQTNEWQTIENVDYTNEDGTATVELTTDALGNQMYYVEWGPETTDRLFSHSYDLTRTERLRPELLEDPEATAEESFDRYLEATTMVPIDGPIKEKSEEALTGEESVVQQMWDIHEWVINYMYRDESVVGCGQGDVLELLENPGGKCTDINSMYQGLARAAGIPSREVFGIRLSTDPESDRTTGQHCWAESYIPGTGWISMDTADVLRGILKEEVSKDSQKAADLAEYYFGNVDAVRVGLTTGRDLILEPAQDGEPLNTFGYPYAEVDGEKIDFYNPEGFKYTINFENVEFAENR